MCGICGVWKQGEILQEEMKLINEMNKVQAHRGPDDEGTFFDSHIALGHRRLSIIDLSEAGHQPLCYNDRYWISFNGEIYNYLELREELQRNKYTFRTKTDTEVICAAYDFWGEECFERFNGFWAIAIYDVISQELCLSRDRYGVKPLYYYRNEEYFLFASEIKALLCDSRIERIINENVIADYLVYGITDHTEETFFRNIYEFPPASYTILTMEMKLNFQHFYKMNINYEIGEIPNDRQIDSFRKIFLESINMRLRSDVEVGACLSGGLDSSAIVCAINRINRDEGKGDLKTFSACFEGFRLDESEYVDEVLKYTRLEGKKITPTGKEFWNDLDDLIYMQDQPFASASCYVGYHLMKQINQNNIKVVMDGQGADEILCGYRKSRIYLIKELFKHRKYFSALKEGVCSVSQFATTDNLYMDFSKILGTLIGKNNKEKNNKFIRPKYAEAKYDYSNSDFIGNDIRVISLPNILRTVDRNSMAFSIEDRLPFLDYHLVDFSVALPLQSKIKNGWSKYIMRHALDLPKKIKYRKTKIGFVPPETAWIKEMEKEMYKIFLNKDFYSRDYIDREAILGNWQYIVSNPSKVPLFRFICLEKWMQIFDVKSKM